MHAPGPKWQRVVTAPLAVSCMLMVVETASALPRWKSVDGGDHATSDAPPRALPQSACSRTLCWLLVLVAITPELTVQSAGKFLALQFDDHAHIAV